MKRILIAILALAGFSVASFAQTVHASKKNEPAKTQVVKKTTDKKVDGDILALNKPAKQATPAVAKTHATTKSAVTTKTVAKTNTTTPLKKDGTADLRYKENKKHS